MSVRRAIGFAVAALALSACSTGDVKQVADPTINIFIDGVTIIGIEDGGVVKIGPNCPATVTFMAISRPGVSAVYRWKSSVPEVGVIDSVSGVFTPKTAGFTGITVYDAANLSHFKTRQVEVRAVASCDGGNGNGLSVTPNPLPLIYGQSGQLTAAQNGTTVAATWTTSDAACATVDVNGLVTAMQKSCSAVITATYNGATGSSTVNVTAPSQNGPTGFSFNPLGFQPKFGGVGAACTSQPYMLVPVFTPAGTSVALTYSSSNPSVVTVNLAGQLSFVGVGTSRITGISPDGKLTGFIDIPVVSCGDSNPTVTSVVVKPNPLPLIYGQSGQLTATVNGTNNPAQSVTWTTSDATCATVNTNGVVTAGQKTCSVTITATSTIDGTKSGSAMVNVSPPSVTNITFPDLNLLYGSCQASSQFALTATTTPAGQPVTYSIVSSSPSGLITNFNSATGTGNYTSAGTFTASATSNGLMKTRAYTIGTCAQPGIRIIPDTNATLIVGQVYHTCIETTPGSTPFTVSLTNATTSGTIVSYATNNSNCVQGQGVDITAVSPGAVDYNVAFTSNSSVNDHIRVTVIPQNTSNGQWSVNCTPPTGSGAQGTKSSVNCTATVPSGQDATLLYFSTDPTRVEVVESTRTFTNDAVWGTGTRQGGEIAYLNLGSAQVCAKIRANPTVQNCTMQTTTASSSANLIFDQKRGIEIPVFPPSK